MRWSVSSLRITTVDAVERLFEDAGVGGAAVVGEDGSLALESPESWWKVAMGSGLRAVVEAAGPDLAESVRQRCVGYIETNNIDSITTNVIYAVAQK